MIEDIAEDERTYNPSVDGASNGGGGHPGPMFLRLAWHCSARRDSAEDFSRLKARRCTAMAWILIPAYCFAIP